MYACINASSFHFPSCPQDIVVTPQALKKIPSGACLLFVPSSSTTTAAAATLHSSTSNATTTATARTTHRKTKANGSEEEEVDFYDDEEVRIGFQSFSKEDIQISGNPVGK